MAFMEYCRFENTTQELKACARALERGEVLSESEDRCRYALYLAAKRYIEAYYGYEPRNIDEED